MLLLAALPVLLGTQPAPPGCIQLKAPQVNMRANVARATSSPWVDANAWRFLRAPAAPFCIDAPGNTSALAAAEAFAYGIKAFIKTSAVEPFNRMLAFLKDLPPADLPAMVNIGLVDDGSPAAGELMNLLSRRNLLYRLEKSRDATVPVNVTRIEPGDPAKQAYAIRRELTDDKRLLRLYGSEVVIGRLTGDARRARLHLLNYSQRPVNGLRVRVLGVYPHAAAHIFNQPADKLADFVAADGATEFTITRLNECAVIDLAL
jgi:hypothetical protein